MSKIEVYNQKAEVVSSLELPDQFKIKTNPKLLTQAILFEKSREIVSSAHVKNRGEVRGGGKKPWKQKGTGRARAGSTRSPLWRTGGVTFAVQRSFKKNLPAKMHKKATFMILSQKFADKKIKIVQELKLEKIQTKFLEQFFKLFNLEKKPTLLILKKMDEKIRKSARNLANLELIYPQNLQMKNLLNSKYVVMDLATFEILKEWGKNLK